ncbi:hypothetical protein ERO13_D07G188100v2 [Gossypium hirsutum]|nr:hypothetical protein ERO13_D07G188100v2 [Gossypium hirsutum]
MRRNSPLSLPFQFHFESATTTAATPRRRATTGEERAWWVWGIAERGWKPLP